MQPSAQKYCESSILEKWRVITALSSLSLTPIYLPAHVRAFTTSTVQCVYQYTQVNIVHLYYLFWEAYFTTYSYIQ